MVPEDEEGGGEQADDHEPEEPDRVGGQQQLLPQPRELVAVPCMGEETENQ